MENGRERPAAVGGVRSQLAQQPRKKETNRRCHTAGRKQRDGNRQRQIKISEDQPQTNGSVTRAKVSPINKPVRISPPNSERRFACESDSPRTAMASV